MAPLRTPDALQHTWAHSLLLPFLVLYPFSLPQVSWRHEVGTGVRCATGPILSTLNSREDRPASSKLMLSNSQGRSLNGPG